MSTETPPPPPPAEGDNSAPQAPKLKLAKPAGAAVPPSPPPPPAAGAPAAPRPPIAPIPAPVAAPAPRVSPTTGAAANRNVGKAAAAFDVLALVASLAAAVFLYLELFSKTKG